MTLTTKIKDIINDALRSTNIKIETLTANRIERDRIQRQIELGYFEKPAFPLLEGMTTINANWLASAYSTCREDIDRLMKGLPPANFDRGNPFYNTPDAEILYLMVRTLEPRRIIEVGSGNSTRIIRQAIDDGKLAISHIAIDPEPRSDITGLIDRLLRQRFEEADVMQEFSLLEANDILFIDSSHQVAVANDVTKLFCNAIPALAPGVVVHVHDVFLPFDYPEPFCIEYSGWGEQYLLQVMLAARPREILWPGYYVQRLHPEFFTSLPFLAGGRAQSFWFKA